MGLGKSFAAAGGRTDEGERDLDTFAAGAVPGAAVLCIASASCLAMYDMNAPSFGSFMPGQVVHDASGQPLELGHGARSSVILCTLGGKEVAVKVSLA